MLIITFVLCGFLLIFQRATSAEIEDMFKKFKQHDYVLEFGRVEQAHFNKDYISYYAITTFKHNRTCPAVNVTYEYKTSVGNDVQVVVQGYKFASNEYRVFPALRVELNFCKALRANVGGMRRLLECGNFTGCPQRKGRVHICNWTPDQAEFPPLLPNGEYMLELQALYHSIEIYIVRFYGSVSRPIVYEN